MANLAYRIVHVFGFFTVLCSHYATREQLTCTVNRKKRGALRQNRAYFSGIGIQREDFNAMTWFSSWAVDGDHSVDPPNAMDEGQQQPIGTGYSSAEDKGVEEAVRHMNSGEKKSLGFICKDIIDMGRLLWLKERGFDAHLVKYVPPEVSPENHLLVAKCT